MKSSIVLLIATVVGTVPALAQSVTSTYTTTPTSVGSHHVISSSDGSSYVTDTYRGRSVSTYTPPPVHSSQDWAMGKGGYKPMGGK